MMDLPTPATTADRYDLLDTGMDAGMDAGLDTGISPGSMSSSPPPAHSTIADMQFYVWGILCPIICFCGILGNILSITVLGHRRMRNSSTSCYLTAQAVYDILVLLSVFFFFSLPVLVEEWQLYYGCFHIWAYPISLAAQSGGIYITVAFTVERWVACCYPLRASNVCTLARARRVVVLVTVAVIIYNLPRTMEYYTYFELDPKTNISAAQYAPTKLGKNVYYQQIYLGYMYVCVMFIAPLLILFVLNICLIRALKKSQKMRRQMSSTAVSSKANDNLTVMVVSVVLVFLICQFWAAIDNMLMILIPERPFTLKFQIFSTLMVTINSAINFVCYCVFGKKFRRVFIMMYINKDVPVGSSFRNDAVQPNNNNHRHHGGSTLMKRMSDKLNGVTSAGTLRRQPLDSAPLCVHVSSDTPPNHCKNSVI